MRRPDRFETHRSMLLAGPRRVYAFAEGPSLIPAAWRAFGGEWPLPGQVGHASYGVTCGADMAAGAFEYMPAVEVETFETLDDRWGRVRLPEAHYAVFAHAGPIGGIRDTIMAAFGWLNDNGEWRDGQTPNFERYAADWSAETGDGVEIWLPVRPA